MKLETKVFLNTISILSIAIALNIHTCAAHAELPGSSNAFNLPYIEQQGLGEAHKVYKPQASELRENAKFRIGVIDTGYNSDYGTERVKLCKTGHYDFYTEKAQIAGVHPHGTMVSELIASPLEHTDYCIVVFQVADASGNITPENVARAIGMASKQNLKAVNISLAGPQSRMIEQKALRALSASGARVFVAAGNDHLDLGRACQVFPACYEVPNMFMVGAMTPDLTQTAHYSNFGTRVKLWYSGESLEGRASGTSFASPRALGDYVYSLSSPVPQ